MKAEPGEDSKRICTVKPESDAVDVAAQLAAEFAADELPPAGRADDFAADELPEPQQESSATRSSPEKPILGTPAKQTGAGSNSKSPGGKSGQKRGKSAPGQTSASKKANFEVKQQGQISSYFIKNSA